MTNPWIEWEDFQAGLYENRPAQDDLIDNSETLLSDPDEFFEVANEMIREWPNAALQNLVHIVTGQQAWIGQASCCYAHGATSEETRQAWGRLSNDIQRRANLVADAALESFVRGRNHGQTLFIH